MFLTNTGIRTYTITGVFVVTLDDSWYPGHLYSLTAASSSCTTLALRDKYIIIITTHSVYVIALVTHFLVICINNVIGRF